MKVKRGGNDSKVKGKKLKKNVRGSKAYKKDKKSRGKDYTDGGFRFGTKKKTGTAKDHLKTSAQKSIDAGPRGNKDQDANAQKVVDKFRNKNATVTVKKNSGTLGNPVKTNKKKVFKPNK